jgi:N-acetylmuramoyl-L-alanine amidase
VEFDFIDRPSPNFDERQLPVSMIVLHYTGMVDMQSALDRLTSPESRVSSHYLVDEDGTIFRLVDESKRAWHAGKSRWRGITDVNSASIGIEIVNPGHEWGYRPFPEPQMTTVERLCCDIMARYPIPPCRVVGHSDIAPERKTDPGELFDWRRLAQAGVGIWPESGARGGPGQLDRTRAVADLAAIGYCAGAAEAAVVAAFQRRFRQARVDGVIDRDTAERLAEISAAYATSRRMERTTL